MTTRREVHREAEAAREASLLTTSRPGGTAPQPPGYRWRSAEIPEEKCLTDVWDGLTLPARRLWIGRVAAEARQVAREADYARTLARPKRWPGRKRTETMLYLIAFARGEIEPEPPRDPLLAGQPRRKLKRPPRELLDLGEYRTWAEAKWTDRQLRDAHARYANGARDADTVAANNAYYRIMNRRSRALRRKKAADGAGRA